MLSIDLRNIISLNNESLRKAVLERAYFIYFRTVTDNRYAGRQRTKNSAAMSWPRPRLHPVGTPSHCPGNGQWTGLAQRDAQWLHPRAAYPWAGILRAARPCQCGVSGGMPLTACSKGSPAFGRGSRGGQPLGRTTSGGEAGILRDGFGVPSARSHRLRCITALFAPKRSGPSRGRRILTQAHRDTALRLADGSGQPSESGS